MAKAQTRRVIAVKALLTPEQVAKALEAVKTMRERRRGHGPRGLKPGAKPEPKPSVESEKADGV